MISFPFLNSFRVKCLIAGLLAFNAIFLVRRFHLNDFWTRRIVDYGAGNATLGFAALLAVAPPTAPPRYRWRKDGLLKAAAYTGLNIQIPVQPVWTDEDTNAIIAKHPMSKGGAMSWLGHLNALKTAATHATSLILEDDADWDIGIRLEMPIIAEAVRNLTRYKTPVQEPGQPAFHMPPYGTEWDVLWLGHCGENVVYDPKPITFADPTVPPYINSWEGAVSPDPKHTRWIHFSAGPICTYAYAITAEGAKKILTRDDHGSEGFDIWLHIRCKGQELRCVSVNPELFHHHEIAGEKDSLINGPSEDNKDVVEQEMTDNIWHSARCNSASRSMKLVTCMGPKPSPKEE
ncbi:uncharacterized protein BDZ99DRAFT_517419 [Mytilinidion resinicola]|uniref:Glycosyltransferase family 25 protein n=1 Tax=Mytilinidion resinicola TaxID=574789 RepID=A0A6A6YXI8_9PEZI|nr:uncharacterized protein BDZ99DRAFT_517419 [Mytilinidion resinicola]KAF2813133.1 hypothetical protein BDZ99DRAFT_517419 [Mytilinidion resinicola]